MAILENAAQIVIGVVLGLAMICSVVEWIRQGFRIPRPVHWFGLGATAVGGLLSLTLLLTASPSPKLLLLCLTAPPVFIYAAYVTFGGPLTRDAQRARSHDS
jgi:hypothetical protein